MFKKTYVRKLNFGTAMNKRQKTSDHNKLLALQRKVSALRPEVKVYTKSGAVTNVSSAAGSLVHLTDLAQGTDINDRLGNKIAPKWMQFNIKYTSDATAGIVGPQVYHAYIIKDKDSNGATPLISGGGGQDIFNGFGPLANQLSTSLDRFTILRTMSWQASSLNTGNEQILKSERIRMSGHTTWDGPATTNVDAAKNHYYLVVLSDDAGNLVDFAYSYNLGFTDA